MAKFYVGITIGPIFDTINEASSPAALWFASNLFSDLTKRLCEAILNEPEFEEVNIYSPYYELQKEQEKWDGVGKYHDRIIFSVSTESVISEKLAAIVDCCKENTAELFPPFIVNNAGAKTFLKDYLQVHFVVKPAEEIEKAEENSILLLSPYLDALELMKTFPQDDAANPLTKLFAGKENSKNLYIKESPLFARVDQENNCMTVDVSGEKSIRTIEDIASYGSNPSAKLKKDHYYAVVTADGDSMGKFLEQISDDQVTEFSKMCLDYDKAAAKLVAAYGGMTIYAGGDDLLFLAPVKTAEKDIFALCKEIHDLFEEKIRSFADFGEKEIPTISFGVSVQYEKYPLYEAMANARECLGQAKSGDKNALCVNLQKHSGQSLQFVISNTVYEDVLKKILKIEKNEGEIADDEMIHSVLYTLNMFAPSIRVLDNAVRKSGLTVDAYKAAWKNFFDNAGQKKAAVYVEKICELYYEKMVKDETGSLQLLTSLLRLKHFLVEKEGDRA